LTALLKNNRGVWPIAVGEVLCCLASRLCCHFVHPLLPDTFLPCGQIGVGIPGGLEGAIHAVRHALSQFGNDESLALLKIDMKNVVNECSCIVFLSCDHIIMIFLKCFIGVVTSLLNYILATNVFLVPQVHSMVIHLVLLLFSSVLLHFLGSNPLNENCFLNWIITHSGLSFGLHIILSKYEPYWPSGDCSFPEFPHAIKQVNPERRF